VITEVAARMRQVDTRGRQADASVSRGSSMRCSRHNQRSLPECTRDPRNHRRAPACLSWREPAAALTHDRAQRAQQECRQMRYEFAINGSVGQCVGGQG